MVPLLLMIYFYYGMLMRLLKQSRMARRTLLGSRRCKASLDDKIPIGRIAAYTLAICLFHFVCWTPYWVSVLYSLYLEVFQPPDLQTPDSSFIYFMYGVHALPYINSASNFILYGLLNRQVSSSDCIQMKSPLRIPIIFIMERRPVSPRQGAAVPSKLRSAEGSELLSVGAAPSEASSAQLHFSPEHQRTILSTIQSENNSAASHRKRTLVFITSNENSSYFLIFRLPHLSFSDSRSNELCILTLMEVGFT
ncbi:unnamed protein product [Anisakis simplex]|uniref:G-protein coupled receptors family 1 profile domain-containing protein n=1 Tax=Anisakis simplex TaxID=6269 RepID=A0A3P6NZG2_ANISI|nr:unnamed protein product [Anisakis simplex]